MTPASSKINAPVDLGEAFRLLHADPARSEEFCRAYLSARDDPSARLMLAGSLRLQHDFAGAEALAAGLTREHPNWSGAFFEHGMALGGLARRDDALNAFRQVERLGGLPGLWREIGDQHWALGDRGKAEQAWLRHLSVSTPEPLVQEAAVALRRKDNVSAEEVLRLQLKHYPADVVALRVLAELLSSTDRYDEAEQILRLCLERVPSFALARYGLAMVLFHDHKLPLALEQIERLLEREPERFEYLDLKADTLGRVGEFEEAAACLETIVALYPNQGGAWSSYGDTLRTLGRRAECEAAYRRAIALNASAGFAYWGLANLKTFKFAPSDVASMGERVQRLSGEDRICLLFALGKALEDQGKYEEAFSNYSQANSERRARLPHDRSEPAETTRRARTTFTRAFFAERERMGCEAPDPIFVVGMPRSGSTLVEQILASHSSVEGTMELIELMAIAKRLGKDGRYPELLHDMRAEELARLGREYLDRARPFRKTGAVRFIDKLPNNFTQAGLIHLVLPNSCIIDVRRHPLACCVSIFKQHWATGQTFAYDLQDIGAFYRSYVELMAHFDAVLPGRVHRVVYEDLVADPQAVTRRLLEACGLPFEENCLRFYENRRAVRTPSSEQVRQPIYSAGLDNWRPFEPWLEPLKSALGPVLEAYPGAPPLQPL